MNKKKLEVKLEDLLKTNQQVAVRFKIKDSSADGYEDVVEVGTLAIIVNKDNTQGLGISIQHDYYLSNQVVRHLNKEDLDIDIDIVQIFGGGGCTLLWAQEFLGLKIPYNFNVCYVSEDDLLVNNELVESLTDLHNRLERDNIKHIFNLKAGQFCIEVKLVD